MDKEEKSPAVPAAQVSAASEVDALKAKLQEQNAAHSAKVSELEAKIAELSKKPADKTSAVVENSKKSDAPEVKSELEQFLDITASVNKLFKSLP